MIPDVLKGDVILKKTSVSEEMDDRTRSTKTKKAM